MRLSRPDRRARPASIVPMINIVFLLLVFFMLTATIAPPDPLQVQPPVARGAAATEGREVTLHVGADGALMIGDARAEAALAALAALPDGTALRVNADAGLDGAAFARLLGRLAAAGVTELSVVVAAP